MKAYSLADEALVFNQSDMVHLVCECQDFTGGYAACGTRIKNIHAEENDIDCIVCNDLQFEDCKYCGGEDD